MPPIEVAEYDINILDDDELLSFIKMIDNKKTLDHVIYYSYIDNHFFIIFEDSSNYIISFPESEYRVVSKVDIINYNNFHMISCKKPPYFLFTQD